MWHCLNERDPNQMRRHARLPAPLEALLLDCLAARLLGEELPQLPEHDPPSWPLQPPLHSRLNRPHHRSDSCLPMLSAPLWQLPPAALCAVLRCCGVLGYAHPRLLMVRSRLAYGALAVRFMGSVCACICVHV